MTQTMLVAVRVALIAVLVECLFFCFSIETAELIFILLPIALIGSLPGMLLYGVLLYGIYKNIKSPMYKWIAIVLATIISSNATLLLTLCVLNERSALWRLTYINAIVTGAALVGVLCSLKSIRKNLFQ